MARDTIRWRARIPSGHMTTATARLFMRARERVLRLIVIEASRLPAAFVVAFLTVLTQRSTMGIGLAVTRNTIARRFAPRDFGRMALLTGERFMLTVKRIVRLSMVKGRLAEAANVRIPTSVVRMAASTLPV